MKLQSIEWDTEARQPDNMFDTLEGLEMQYGKEATDSDVLDLLLRILPDHYKNPFNTTIINQSATSEMSRVQLKDILQRVISFTNVTTQSTQPRDIEDREVILYGADRGNSNNRAMEPRQYQQQTQQRFERNYNERRKTNRYHEHAERETCRFDQQNRRHYRSNERNQYQGREQSQEHYEPQQQTHQVEQPIQPRARNEYGNTAVDHAPEANNEYLLFTADSSRPTSTSNSRPALRPSTMIPPLPCAEPGIEPDTYRKKPSSSIEIRPVSQMLPPSNSANHSNLSDSVLHYQKAMEQQHLQAGKDIDPSTTPIHTKIDRKTFDRQTKVFVGVNEYHHEDRPRQGKDAWTIDLVDPNANEKTPEDTNSAQGHQDLRPRLECQDVSTDPLVTFLQLGTEPTEAEASNQDSQTYWSHGTDPTAWYDPYEEEQRPELYMSTSTECTNGREATERNPWRNDCNSYRTHSTPHTN